MVQPRRRRLQLKMEGRPEAGQTRGSSSSSSSRVLTREYCGVRGLCAPGC